jgi:hypothetical protein
VSEIAGPQPIAGTPGQSQLATGSSPAGPAARHELPSSGAFTITSGTLWAAQVASTSPRGFVLLVAGIPFDIDGRPPGPPGTSLLVRAHVEDGATVFEVLPSVQPARATDALRVALGHVLHKALGPVPAEPLPVLPSQPASALAAGLSEAIRERLSEPSPSLADYLTKGLLRLDIPVVGAAGEECTWQLEIDPDSWRGGEGQESACTITLFATLPGTGPTETRLTLARESLVVRFVVASDDACALIESSRDELQDALLALGFSPVVVEAVASPAQLARDRVNDAPPHDMPLLGGLLDIRA